MRGVGGAGASGSGRVSRFCAAERDAHVGHQREGPGFPPWAEPGGAVLRPLACSGAEGDSGRGEPSGEQADLRGPQPGSACGPAPAPWGPRETPDGDGLGRGRRPGRAPAGPPGLVCSVSLRITPGGRAGARPRGQSTACPEDHTSLLSLLRHFSHPPRPLPPPLCEAHPCPLSCPHSTDVRNSRKVLKVQGD